MSTDVAVMCKCGHAEVSHEGPCAGGNLSRLGRCLTSEKLLWRIRPNGRPVYEYVHCPCKQFAAQNSNVSHGEAV